MRDDEICRIVDALTERIMTAGAALGGIKSVEVVPHAVSGHFICRVMLEPLANRRAYRTLFNGTAVRDSIYFTERAPVAVAA